MYKIGVDLGGTNIAVGVVDESYRIIGRGKRKTALPRPAEEIFDDIKNAIDLAVADAGISPDEVSSIGVGAPGSINKEKRLIEYANNLGFNNVPAYSMLEERTGKPCFFDNDANAAALGEAYAGAGKGAKSFIALTFGTGVGAGIVIDGKIYGGFNDAGGEIGHMVICVDGIPCNCGRRGCWEEYASATALISQTKDMMNEHPESKMWEITDNDLSKVNGRTPFQAMYQGDAPAKEVVDRYINYMAAGITNVVNIFQPEIICIGGGISHEGDNLLNPIKEIVAKERYTKYADKQTTICRAALGNDAGIIGAALLG